MEIHQQKALQHRLAHQFAKTKHHDNSDDSNDENNMSTDSIMEEKIMLNLLDMHKKAKLLITAPEKAERDFEALERSLIKQRGPVSPVSKTPRGKPPKLQNFESNPLPANIPLSTKHLALPP